MAETLSNGVVVPEGSDLIHSSGVQAMRNMGGSIDAQLGAKVGTNDSRLSDARTPTSHVHPVAQVSGLQSALDAKARKEPIDLAEQNLNDVIDEGPYIQAASSRATLGRNYPPNSAGLAQAGFLEVISRPGDYLVLQRYTTFNGEEMSFRARYAGAWYSWERSFRAAEGATMQAQIDALRYRSGRRNITALLDPAPASGSLFLERRGDTVWLTVDGIVYGQNAASLTFYNVIPSGFQAPNPVELASAPRTQAEMQGNFRTYSHVFVMYRLSAGEAARGLVSWPTNQPIPTDLPGASA